MPESWEDRIKRLSSKQQPITMPEETKPEGNIFSDAIGLLGNLSSQYEEFKFETGKKILQILEEPGRLMNVGVSQLGDNPIAGSINIGNSILSLVASPFSVADATVRELPGGKTLADAVALPFEQTALGIQRGTEVISDLTSGLPSGVKNLGLNNKTAKEVQEALSLTNQMGGQFLIAGLGGKAFKQFRGKEVPKTEVSEIVKEDIPKNKALVKAETPINLREVPKEEQIAKSQVKLEVDDLINKREELKQKFETAKGKEKNSILKEIQKTTKSINSNKEILGEKINVGDVGVEKLTDIKKEEIKENRKVKILEENKTAINNLLNESPELSSSMGIKTLSKKLGSLVTQGKLSDKVDLETIRNITNEWVTNRPKPKEQVIKTPEIPLEEVTLPGFYGKNTNPSVGYILKDNPEFADLIKDIPRDKIYSALSKALDEKRSKPSGGINPPPPTDIPSGIVNEIREGNKAIQDLETGKVYSSDKHGNSLTLLLKEKGKEYVDRLGREGKIAVGDKVGEDFVRSDLPKEKQASGEFGSKNKLFTKEKFNEADKYQKDNLNKLGANPFLDPKYYESAFNKAGYYFEGGARTFADFSKRMINEFGDQIKPYLLKLWSDVKKQEPEILKNEKQTSQATNLFGEGMKDIAKKDRETIYKEAEKIAEEKSSIVNKVKNVVIETKEGLNKLAKTVLEPISTSVEKVSKPLFRKFREFGFNYQRHLLERHGVVGDYFDAKKKAKLDTQTNARFNIALLNGWFDDARTIALKHGFSRQFEKMLNIKDELAKELGVKAIENHFPRMVQDFEGFVHFLEEKFPDYYKDNFSRMIAEKSGRIGRELTYEEKANLINNALRGYNPGIMLSDLGNMKKRIIPILDGELSRFYKSPDESLISYINQMTELSEARKFFGKGGFDINESIGAYIQDLREGNKLNIEGSRELMDIFKARFNQKGTSKGINVLRDVGVVTKLANPFTTLTQLKDLAYSFYFSPTRTPGILLKTLAGSKSWEIKDLGIDPLKYAEELANPKKRSEFVQNTLNISGFSKLDMIGKETLINTLWDKYQSQAKQTKLNVEFERRIERYFGKGEEKTRIMNDLKSGKKTDSTAFLLYNELVGAQPISLLELPRGYLKGGNWRIAYFLKTFAVRQLDFALNETIRVMGDKTLPKAQRKQGAYNLFKLTTSLALVGTTVDQVRNMVMNSVFNTRKQTITEDIVDNLLNVALLSRYDYTKSRDEGLGTALGSKIVPPLDIIGDPLLYDIPNILAEKGRALRTTRNIPIVGRFVYEYLKNKNKGSSGFPTMPSMPEI